MEAAKAFVMTDLVREGDFLDVKDSIGNWCVAQVLQLRYQEGAVLIHYDGWSHKWDEVGLLTQVVSLDSPRVKRFRSRAQGYTGQDKFALGRTLTLPQCVALRERMAEVRAKWHRAFSSSYELTQFLCGHLFIAIDFVLSYEYRDKEEVDAGHSLIMDFVVLVVEWLTHLPSLAVQVGLFHTRD